MEIRNNTSDRQQEDLYNRDSGEAAIRPVSNLNDDDDDDDDDDLEDDDVDEAVETADSGAVPDLDDADLTDDDLDDEDLDLDDEDEEEDDL